MSFLPVDEQLELISRGTEEVIPLNDLRKKLEKSKGFIRARIKTLKSI
jgi:tyrosyl-tRNA synthetase